jgi:uncharacterized HhH-GPD family protein
MALNITQDEEADELVSHDGLALLVAMVLDQQIPLERAFHAPLELRQRLGGRLDAAGIAAMDPAALARVFAEPPALHRFPASMARRVQELCQVLVESYQGDAATLWRSAPSGAELLHRVRALPGFGDQKARIFVALLGKQFDVAPDGWAEAATPFGTPGSFLSVADIDGPESLARVRDYKKQRKAEAKASGAAPSSGRARAGQGAAPSPRRR